MSKKYCDLWFFAMVLSAVAFFSSCQEVDLDVSETVLKQHAFEYGFAQEFGQPSADQRWDFYTQMMERLRGGDVAATRAAGDMHVVDGITFREDAYGVAIVSNDQRKSNGRNSGGSWNYNNNNPEYDSRVKQPTLLQDKIDEWAHQLPEGEDNTGKGTSGFTLKAPSSGLFTVSAVMYNGYFSRFYTQQFMEIGIEITTQNGGKRRYRLFGGGGLSLKSGALMNIWNPVSDPEAGFGSWTTAENEDATPNPHWAAYVYLNPEKIDKFNFYFCYQDGGSSHRYDSSEDGRTMLLYSTETDTETIMMLGFEDTNTDNPNNTLGTDINDFILYLSGDLPVPTSKRFICEDLYSLDWDYNDVVFDVSNTGWTLRAVGGTLPVYMKINGVLTQELHELLGSKQTSAAMQNRELTYTKIDKNGVEKTYYKPINVGDSKHGIKLDPQKIETWTESAGTRLTDTQLEAWNNVELYVAKEYQGPESLLTNVEDVTKVGTASPGEYPAIIEVPFSVTWMKEMTKITKGYPTFYLGNNPNVSPQAEDDQWYNYGKVVGNLYTSKGDSE